MSDEFTGISEQEEIENLQDVENLAAEDIKTAEIEEVDESLFTGNKKKDKTNDEILTTNLHEHFSPKQIGSIAKYTEPISGYVSLEDVTQMFKENEELEVLPVEEEDNGVVGFVERQKILSVADWKKIISNSKVIDYTQRVDFSLNATDFIEKTLKKIAEYNRKYNINYFPVFNRKNFFGLVSLNDFLDRIAEIRAQDLAKASVIQQSTFPSYDLIWDLPYSFHFYNKMANELGGDLIQVYKFSEKRSLICNFDVSGRNVAASLLTVAISSFFKTLIATDNGEKNPVRVIAMLDGFLESIVPSGNFIKAMFCYVDLDCNKICLFNCGHTTAYLIKKSEVESIPSKYMEVEAKLPPLGMGVVKKQLLASLTEQAANKPYLAYNLTRGLHFNTYSDGLTEMMNEQGKHFEAERTKEFFENLYNLNDDEVEEYMEKKVSDWVGKTMIPDDITILDIRF